jgi:hypothetical protein
MPNLLLPFNLLLKVGGIKGGYFHSFHNSPCAPLILRGGLEEFGEIQMLNAKPTLFCHLSFVI